jgi:hypothetical protein
VELNIRQYYQDQFPGQVEVIGVDQWNGTQSQLRSFGAMTGATYPLLLLGNSATGGDIDVLYGPNDSHFVISKQGVVRLNTLKWPHGQRFRLNEIRAAIDSLVTPVTAVGDPVVPASLSLRVSPNPFRGSTTIELANPGHAGAPSRVTVHDVAGRLIAQLWDGPVPSGITRIAWDGRSSGGTPMAAGVYVVRARVGGTALTRRIVRIP